jgi:hypothetical protein
MVLWQMRNSWCLAPIAHSHRNLTIVMGQCNNETIAKDHTPWCMMQADIKRGKESTAWCEMQPSSFGKEALRRSIRATIMTKKSEEEFCVQYHAKKSCHEASGKFLTRSITLGTAYSITCPSSESNHEPKGATEAPMVHHPMFTNTIHCIFARENQHDIQYSRCVCDRPIY